MVELVDTQVSKTCEPHKLMSVRLRLAALLNFEEDALSRILET